MIKATFTTVRFQKETRISDKRNKSKGVAAYEPAVQESNSGDESILLFLRTEDENKCIIIEQKHKPFLRKLKILIYIKKLQRTQTKIYF